jgi:hypothetical protein
MPDFNRRFRVAHPIVSVCGKPLADPAVAGTGSPVPLRGVVAGVNRIARRVSM